MYIRKSRQKLKNKTEDLSNTTNQVDLRDMYNTYDAITIEYIVSSTWYISTKYRPNVRP